MIDHLSLHVRDLDKSKAFYTKALAPLGYALISDYPQWKVAGFGAGRPDIWLSGKEVTQATHVALAAESKEIVDACVVGRKSVSCPCVMMMGVPFSIKS
jgi:catechol 2,3-dioxygenase-like lactoylglutathione lyase family enzyme